MTILTFVLFSETDFRGYWSEKLYDLLEPYDGIMIRCACYDDEDGPQSDCRECAGTGMTYKKHIIYPRWDSWEVGYRRKGIFKDVKTKINCEDFPNSSEYKNVHDNCCIVSEIPSGITPHAIITPDGEWYSPDIMLEDEEQWPDTSRSILAQHSDYIAVACLLHY